MNNEGMIGNSESAADVTGSGRPGAGKSSSAGRSGSGRAAAPADKGARGQSLPRPRICVIDPERELLLDLESVFGAMGYEVLGLGRVIGASNQIRAFAPDLLIVDVMMPTVSGGKLIEVLRLNLSAMPPLILYSRLLAQDLARLAHNLQADDFIVKNGDLLPLVARVKLHLNMRRPQSPGVSAADDPVRPRLHKGRGQ